MDFMNNVVRWMKEEPRMWRGTAEFGDRNLEDDDDYLLIQKSLGSKGKGFTIQVIGVRKGRRRQGIATNMMDIVENTARELHVAFVAVQSIQSKKMLALVKKRGYVAQQYDFTSCVLLLVEK